MFFCVLCLAFGAAGASEMTLEGLVEAAVEDASGNPKSIQLSVEEITEDGEIVIHIYAISSAGRGKELMANIGETVKVTGPVKTNKNGSKTITVNDFEVLSTPTEEDYPDEDYTGDSEE